MSSVSLSLPFSLWFISILFDLLIRFIFILVTNQFNKNVCCVNKNHNSCPSIRNLKLFKCFYFIFIWNFFGWTFYNSKCRKIIFDVDETETSWMNWTFHLCFLFLSLLPKKQLPDTEMFCRFHFHLVSRRVHFNSNILL